MFHKISCDQVKMGMYIRSFGGSWFGHPFWRARFLLTSAEDVERVRLSGVPYVLIDDERGLGPEELARPAAPSLPQGSVRAAFRGMETERPMVSAVRRIARPRASGAMGTGQNQREAAEQKAAAALVNRSKKVVKALFEGARMGRPVKVADALPVVDEVTAAVLRNRRALLKVIRLKTKDEYTYFHSVAVCTLMLNMAFHLGMDEDVAKDFGLAGLLHDLGKMGVPEEILNKPASLSDEEMAVMRGHPGHGYQLLADIAEMPAVVLDAVYQHHERIDGAGYPVGLKGDEIGLAGRLCAICDIYDALTSQRPYKAASSPAEAIATMWGWQGHLDRKLLFSFMQSIGVFPAGALARLRSNRLGIVLDAGKRNARPRVLAFYCARELEFLEPDIAIIDDSLAADQVVSLENPLHWAFEDWAGLSEKLMKGAKRQAA